MTLKLSRAYVIALVLLVAGGVLAAASSGPINLVKLQTWLSGGVYVGPGATADTGNKLTKEWHVSTSFDFDGGFSVGDTKFGPVLNVTTSGSSFPSIGDDCQVTVDSTVFQGDVPGCGVAADGGIAFWINVLKASNNQPDAGFYITVRSHQ